MASYRERFLFTLNDDGSDVQSTKTGRMVKLDRNETMELIGELMNTQSLRKCDDIIAEYIGPNQVKYLTENKYKIIRRERIDEANYYGHRIYCSNGLTFELIRTKTFGNNEAYWHIFEYDNGSIVKSFVQSDYKGSMVGSSEARMAINGKLKELNKI